MGRNKSKAFLRKQASKRIKKSKQKTTSNRKKKQEIDTTNIDDDTMHVQSPKDIKKMDKFNAQFNDELLNAQNANKNIRTLTAATLNLNSHTIQDIMQYSATHAHPNHNHNNNNNNNNNNNHHKKHKKQQLMEDTLQEFNQNYRSSAKMMDVLSNGTYHTNNNNGSDADDHSTTAMSLQSEITIIADDFLNMDEESDAFFELNENFEILITSNQSIQSRLQALSHINHAFRRRVFDDYLQMSDRMQTLYAILSNCVRRGNITEQWKAIETVGLVCISLQTGVEFFVRNFQPMLLKIIQNPTSQKVRIKAVEVWACLAWVMDDNSSKLQTLKSLEAIWQFNLSHKQEIEEAEAEEEADYSPDPDAYDPSDDFGCESVTSSVFTENSNRMRRIPFAVCIAALEAWTFLLCAIGDCSLIGSLLENFYKPLQGLLKSSDFDLRITAGKALTVLMHNYNTALETDPDFESQDVNTNKLEARFEEIVNRSNRSHRSHGNRQKAKFRNYLKTLQGLWVPSIRIKLRSKVFTLDGWNVWIQYHFVKKILEHGLQPHLLENENLKHVFGIEIESDMQLLSKLEKHQVVLQQNTKQKYRKQTRSKDRKNKNAFRFAND